MTDQKLIDEHFMRQALELAAQAETEGEVPVGAVLVKAGEIVAQGYNQSIALHDASAHAEIQAIRRASELTENYRLPNTTLYVTLEPCAMCAGALIHARIKRLVFGALDKKAGAVCSIYQLLDSNPKQHQVMWESGVLESTCSTQLTTFFKHRRQQKRSCCK